MNKGNPSDVATDFKQTPVFVRILLVILLAALAFVIFYHWSASRRFEQAQSQFASSTIAFKQQIQELEKNIADLTEEKNNLSDDLRKEKRRNDKFSSQIEEISGTVSVLDKLRKTDSELLKKYSKVAFLNENYLPEGLTKIDKVFLSNAATESRIHVKVDSFLQDILEAAKDSNNEVRVVSAYRSFGTQGALKSGYAVVYGSGANQFSADQGYSEHQLGTTVDFSTPALSGVLDGFDKTSAYEWLKKNAYRYGFILSYPPDNAYYQFEPWHWRFVGVDLAKDLHRNGKYFYDMDQREIDVYLVNIFD